MLWKKVSAEVGLAGLEPCEAARGAMFLECFQNMPDPLKEEIDIETRVQYSTLYLNSLHALRLVACTVQYIVFKFIACIAAHCVYSTVHCI